MLTFPRPTLQALHALRTRLKPPCPYATMSYCTVGSQRLSSWSMHRKRTFLAAPFSWCWLCVHAHRAALSWQRTLVLQQFYHKSLMIVKQHMTRKHGCIGSHSKHGLMRAHAHFLSEQNVPAETLTTRPKCLFPQQSRLLHTCIDVHGLERPVCV